MRLDKDEIIYMLKTNKIVVFTVVGFIALVIVLFSVKPSDEEDAGTDIVTVSTEMQELEKTLSEKFSILEEEILPDSSKEHLTSMYYKLYLKDKKLDSDDYNSYIDEFISMVKFKKNINGKYISTIKIELYDRKILADKNILPIAYTTYQLSDLPENAKESDKDLVQYSEDSDKILWETSNNNDGIPDYELYTTNNTYNHNSGEGIIPLTDSEINYLVKIFEFNLIKKVELISLDSLDDVLLWDYGLSPYSIKDSTDFESYSISIHEQFNSILYRFAQSYGDINSFYYGNNVEFKESVLRNKLIVENPKIANYLINGVISKTNVDAKKQLAKTEISESDLVDINSETIPYLDMFIEDAKQKLENDGIEATDDNVNDYIFKEKGNIKEDKKEEKEFEKPKKEDKEPDSSKEKEKENKNDAFSDDNVK